MTSKDEKRKGIGWFKAFDQSTDQSKEDNLDQQANLDNNFQEEERYNIKEDEEEIIQNDNPLFSKDNQDKMVLDLIVSVENLIKDRQLLLYSNKDLESQLSTAHQAINRIKQESMKKDHLILEKDKEIRGLETNLTNKQMSYEQLLENYKEYQNNTNADYEKISIQLDTEINKYSKLNEELKNAQYQNMLKISEFEEKVRILNIENEQFKQQYKMVVEEKAELMKTINDFTDRMSFSLSPRTNTGSSDSK